MLRPAYHQKPIIYTKMKPSLGAHERKTPSTAAFAEVAKVAKARGIMGGSLTEQVQRLGLKEETVKIIFMRHAGEIWERARARGERVASREVFVANRVKMLMQEFRGE